jgi:hypothetical protein
MRGGASAATTQSLLLDNKERDLIAPRTQTPRSASEKDAPIWRDSSVFFGAIRNFAVSSSAQ